MAACEQGRNFWLC